MARIWEGKPNAKSLRFAIVVGRFNSTVTDKLLEGAQDALGRARGETTDVDIVRVPGSFEIPLAAKRLAETGRVSAVICLGAIIKGGTPHWDYLSQAVTLALCQASLQTGVPITNAVLTTENLEQAVARAGRGGDNKGYAAALAAVEMADLCRQLDTAPARED